MREKLLNPWQEKYIKHEIILTSFLIFLNKYFCLRQNLLFRYFLSTAIICCQQQCFYVFSLLGTSKWLYLVDLEKILSPPTFEIFICYVSPEDYALGKKFYRCFCYINCLSDEPKNKFYFKCLTIYVCWNIW